MTKDYYDSKGLIVHHSKAMCCIEPRTVDYTQNNTSNASILRRKDRSTTWSDNLEKRCLQSRSKDQQNSRAKSEPPSSTNRHGSDNFKGESAVGCAQNDAVCKFALGDQHEEVESQVICKAQKAGDTTYSHVSRRNHSPGCSDTLEEQYLQCPSKAPEKCHAESEPPQIANDHENDNFQSESALALTQTDAASILTQGGQQEELESQAICESQFADGMIGILKRPEYTIRKGKRIYVNQEILAAAPKCEEPVSSHQKDDMSSESDGFKSDNVSMVEEGVSCLHVQDAPTNTASSMNAEQSESQSSSKECQDGFLWKRENGKLTKDDYRKIKKIIFSSEVGISVVYISLEQKENRIDIYVETGRLKEMESFLIDSFSKECFHDLFDVMEGASVKLAVVQFSANAENQETAKEHVIGDSLSQIKAGVKISHPDITKIKAISEDEWELEEGIDPHEVEWKNGTVGAICKDKLTQRLYLLTAGHTYQKGWGFQKQNAYTHCKLLEQSGKSQQHFISKTSLSFMGEDEHENAIDVAAIPLFKHYQNHVSPYFGRGMSPVGEHTQDNEDILVSVFTGPSEDLIYRHVQKRGAVTGYSRGTIIEIDADIQIEIGGEKKLLSNCILVASDTELASLGDSGALIIDDQQNGHDKKAIGIFFCLLEGLHKYKSPTTGEPYKCIAVCVRLDKSLQLLNSKVEGLDLCLYSPKKDNTDTLSKVTLVYRRRSIQSLSEGAVCKSKKFAQSKNKLENSASTSGSGESSSLRIEKDDINNSALKRRSWGPFDYIPLKQPKPVDEESSDTITRSNILRKFKGNTPRQQKYNTFPCQTKVRCKSEPCMDQHWWFARSNNELDLIENEP